MLDAIGKKFDPNQPGEKPPGKYDYLKEMGENLPDILTFLDAVKKELVGDFTEKCHRLIDSAIAKDPGTGRRRK